MEPSRATPVTKRNVLLDSLSDSQYEQLVKSGETCTLSARTMIAESGATLDYVYFPESGFASMVVPLENGSAVEAITVGYDGFVGLPIYLGETSTLTRTMIQVTGLFHKIPKETFLRLVEKNDAVRQRVHQYAQITLETLSQSSACNRFHSIEQRCARWLLISHDRALSDDFELTQEFLSQMIGVRRPGVTVAASTLQHAGLISYKRGHMHILDRKGLEAVACECYSRIKEREKKIFRA